MARNDEIALGRMNSSAQKEDLGNRLAYTPVVVRKVVGADATGGLSIDIPYDMYITDVVVQCTAANGSGTMLLKKGATAITDAIICAVNHVVDRAGTIDDAQHDIGPSDTVTVTSNGAADRGIVYIYGMRY